MAPSILDSRRGGGASSTSGPNQAASRSAPPPPKRASTGFRMTCCPRTRTWVGPPCPSVGMVLEHHRAQVLAQLLERWAPNEPAAVVDLMDSEIRSHREGPRIRDAGMGGVGLIDDVKLGDRLPVVVAQE